MLSERDLLAQKERVQDYLRVAEMERLQLNAEKPTSTFVWGTVTGMIGGLAGTISMYLFGACIFVLMRWPANTSFTIIGDSAAAFFAQLGVALDGGSSLGMRLYFLIGLALGAILGFAVASLEPLHLASPKKRVGLSILYVEVMSLPLLAAGTLALKMSTADAVLWFGISFLMHLVYGLVLGMVISHDVYVVHSYNPKYNL